MFQFINVQKLNEFIKFIVVSQFDKFVEFIIVTFYEFNLFRNDDEFFFVVVVIYNNNEFNSRAYHRKIYRSSFLDRLLL